MTTCDFVKENVSALQVSALMRLVGSEHNTGKTHMWLAYEENGVFHSMARTEAQKGPPVTFRHISVMKIEPSDGVSGTYTINIKMNCFLEPAPGETKETAGGCYHWTSREDNAPVPVPRSLVLAMHDALGIFPSK